MSRKTFATVLVVTLSLTGLSGCAGSGSTFRAPAASARASAGAVAEENLTPAGLLADPGLTILYSVPGTNTDKDSVPRSIYAVRAGKVADLNDGMIPRLTMGELSKMTDDQILAKAETKPLSWLSALPVITTDGTGNASKSESLWLEARDRKNEPHEAVDGILPGIIGMEIYDSHYALSEDDWGWGWAIRVSDPSVSLQLDQLGAPGVEVDLDAQGVEAKLLGTEEAAAAASARDSARAEASATPTAKVEIPKADFRGEPVGAVKDVKILDCPTGEGEQTATLKVTNSNRAARDYAVVVIWIYGSGGAPYGAVTREVRDLAPGESRTVKATAHVQLGADKCVLNVSAGTLA